MSRAEHRADPEDAGIVSVREGAKRVVRRTLAAFCHRVPVRGRARAVALLGPYLVPTGGFDAMCWNECRLPLDLEDPAERLMYYGLWEPRELRALAGVVRPGDVFFDVGAHVGFYTLFAASRVGSAGEVHGFEPVPSNFRRLSAAVEANALPQVRLSQVAVGARDGRASLYTLPGEAGAASPMMSTILPLGTGGRLEVDMVTLDAYVARHGIRRVDVVKVDVEGGEWAVLQGMRGVLTSLRPRAILMELWSSEARRRYHGADAPAGSQGSAHDAQVLLARLGYEMTPVHAEPAADGVDDMLFVARADGRGNARSQPARRTGE